MGNWLFGGSGKRANEVTSHDRAMLDLKAQRDKLRQYTAKVNHAIEKEKQYAATMLREERGDAEFVFRKERARMALRRKRYQEILLEKAEQTFQNVAEMIDSIEFAVVEKTVMEGLKRGNSVLSDIHREIGGAEAVEDILADTQEAIDRQNEIDAAISGVLNEEDDNAILDELALLQSGVGMEVESKLSQLPKVPGVPPREPVEKVPAPLQRKQVRLPA